MPTSLAKLSGHLHCLRILAVWLGLVATSLAQTVPFLFDHPSPAPATRLVWQTTPGVRYDLWQSGDLSAWLHVPGFPAAASGLSQEYPFTAGPRGFFRIVPIDEQPPVIAEQFPADNGFAVGRFADLVIRLEDPSGIAPASIRLTVGSIGPLAVGAPGLTFANGTLTYDSGVVALGDFGATISATLVAADTLGNTLTHTWSFKLEPSPLIASNIFVFGSPPALAAGQKLAGPAAAIAARLSPDAAKVPASSAPWSIETVTANTIVIAYTPGNAPTFAVGQLICNLAPARESEIFYRRVLSSANDTANSRLTLTTENATLGDFITRGAAASSSASVIYQVDPTGALVLPSSLTNEASLAQPSFVKDLSFPRTGIDLSGAEFKLGSGADFEAKVLGVTYSQGSSAHWLNFKANELSWWFTPRLHLALEMDEGNLKNFEAIASGDMSLNAAFDGDITLTGLSTKTTIWQLAGPLRPRYWMLVSTLPPVWVEILFTFRIETEAKAEAVLSLGFEYHQDVSASFGITYDQPSGIHGTTAFQASSPDLGGSAALAGKFSLEFKLIPQVNVLVDSCAGFAASFEPHAGIEVKAGTGGFVGKVDAGLDFTVAPTGPLLNPFISPDWELSLEIWKGEWPLMTLTLAFATHPQSKTVAPGASTSFTCTVDSSQPAAFQWFHNGSPIPGQTSRTLFLPSVSSGYAGSYFVRATAGSATADSNTATLTVQVTTPNNIDSDGDGIPDIYETNTGVWVSPTNTGTNPFKWDTDGDGLSDGVETHTGVFVALTNTGTDPNKRDTDNDGVNDKAEIDAGTDPNAPPPPNMALIPAGNFQMGDPVDGTRPVTTVYVSAFYMEKFEVTKALWDEVHTWAIGNGYAFAHAGSGKASNHPVQSINWYDTAKWCNARSEKEGLTPAYYTDDAKTVIYRTGDANVTSSQTAWDGNGYRMPTSAEFEKAARGGIAGRRFPWGDTISHSQANYNSDATYSFDVSPTRGFHPTYAVGGFPYTSPVGSFAPNGYGLYDMIGNVFEWCTDGPLVRGGSWRQSSPYPYRVASVFAASRSFSLDNQGFRCVRR